MRAESGVDRRAGRAGDRSSVSSRGDPDLAPSLRARRVLRAGGSRRGSPRRSGGSTNGNRATSPSPIAVICRITEARFVRRISGSVNSVACLEVLLGVQTDADAGRHPTAAPRALVGRRLRHRLDRESLHLEPPAVPRDPRRAGIDDVPHAGHGDRRLGDVRRQHDPTTAVRLEDPVLLGRRQARVERQHLGVAARSLVARGAHRRRRGSHVLRCRNTSTSPSALLLELGDRVDHGAHLIAVGRPGRRRCRHRTAGTAPRPGTCGPPRRRPGPATPSARRSVRRTDRCRSSPT